MTSTSSTLENQAHRLAVAVNRRLSSSTYRELRNIRCICQAGKVILRGRVSSYYLKQRAQAEVQSVISVEEINNQLEVKRPSA